MAEDFIIMSALQYKIVQHVRQCQCIIAHYEYKDGPSISYHGVQQASYPLLRRNAEI